MYETHKSGFFFAGCLLVALVVPAASAARVSAASTETAVPPETVAAQTPGEDRVELNRKTFERAWTLIDERYWDPTFGGLDWQGVHDELLPRAEAAGTDRALRQVLNDMIERLGQSHFGVIPGGFVESVGSTGEPGDSETNDDQPACTADLSERVRELLAAEASAATDAGPGFDVALIGDLALAVRVEPDGPASSVGAGWELVRIDQQPLADLTACLGAELSERARRSLRYGVITGLLQGDEGEEVEVELVDGNGARHVLRIARRVPRDTQIARFGNLPPLRVRFESRRLKPEDSDLEVGLIRFDFWMVPVANLFEDAMVAFRDADGIVVDLRGNPGGIAGLAAGIGGYFLDQPKSLGTLVYRRDQLHLNVNPRLVTRGGEKLATYRGPLAILVDQFSASTSEIFAAGMQDAGRARLFGETTAAAALPAVIERLPNGDLLMHAMADLERPGGGRIEGVGVTPDVEVEPTRESLLRGEDSALAAALDWIERQASRAAAAAR